jgi:hypothetical protein
MAYGPGRSRLVQGTLVGAVLWLVGYLATAVVLALAFDTGLAVQFGWLSVIHALVVIWFVVVTVLGPDTFLLAMAAVGVATSVLFALGGAVTAARTDAVERPWEAAAAGGTVGVGHVLSTAVAFALARGSSAEQFTAVTWTFALVFGGLVVPAAFGAVGGVLWHYSRRP